MKKSMNKFVERTFRYIFLKKRLKNPKIYSKLLSEQEIFINSIRNKNVNKCGFSTRSERKYVIMCKACELSKYIVNGCIERNYDINTAKVQKLLVLMHGTHLALDKGPLFPENVLFWKCGVAIEEVDRQFKPYALGFEKEKFPTLLALLDSEREVMINILDRYGKKDVFELNADARLKELIANYDKDNIGDIIPNERIERVFKEYDLH